MKKAFTIIQKTSAGWSVLLVRLALALIFIKGGLGKLFGLFGGHGIEGTAGFFQQIGIPFATFNVYLVGCVELIGGAALLFGFLSRIFSVLLSIVMVVAIFTAHNPFTGGAFHYPMVVLAACLVILETGSGKFSMDKMMSK